MSTETTTPACPECGSEFTYELQGNHVCSMCAHEWPVASDDGPAGDGDGDGSADDGVIRDSVGNVLADGDTVVVIQDLKVKGASQAIKRGTKVKGIRLAQGVGDHDISCKIDGFGAMQLKSSVVKKA